MKKYEKELLAYRLRINDIPHKNANMLPKGSELGYSNDVNIRMTYKLDDLITQITKKRR